MYQLLNVLSVMQVLLALVPTSVAVPIAANANCPVPTTSSELGTPKVLNLHEIKGHKVRLQFFYPSEDSSRRFLESMESTTTLSPSGTIMYRARTAADNSSIVSGSGEIEDTEGSLEMSSDLFTDDIYCQWSFRAGNESQLLSLTFEKLSAPYSENCEQAYVALQKENGYESRWCGNRRQANARPMSLLARSSVVVTVFRSGKAPLLPSTGFKVSVKELDASSLQGVENSLRVLLG